MSSITASGLATHRVYLTLNRPLRVAGAFYAVYGAAALGKVAESSAGFGMAGAILLLFTLFGLGLILTVRSLRIEHDRYVLTAGFWPFVHRQEGAVSEVASVQVHREFPTLPEGADARVLIVSWTDARAPLEVLRAPASDRRFDARAAEIASAFGVGLQK